MKILINWIKRHQLLAYFILTYVITWILLFIFQPFYLEGQRLVAPLISLSVFAPALVSIGLSTMLNSGPREGNRKPAVIAFIIAWILASLIIVLYLVINQEMEVTFRFVIVCVITGLLPSFVVSSIFSTTPAVRDQLLTYIKPRGSIGYYLLALGLIPAIWLLGNLLSRAMGMDVSFSRYTVVDAKLVLMVILFYFYNIIYGGLSEEPGWRGFALPRLQSKFSPLIASLILGVIWAVWHAPGRFGGIEAKSLTDTLVEWFLIVLVTIIFTFLFNRTKGSILVTVLIHPAMNTTGNFLNASLGTLILLLVFTIFVIVVDRMWKKLDPENPAIYHPSTPEIN
ncbi:MAG: CPBP family intramembrane metalloprotease [Anaerolineaceae bacterium]|nr:CPBP family intramembrane metalloprotease [Anaerolineaceae bacterium]